MSIFGVALYKVVIIGGFAFMLGFFTACLLASAGMASRDQERIAGRRVPCAEIREKL